MEGILFLLPDGGVMMSTDGQIIRDPNRSPKKKKKSGSGLNSNAVKLGAAGVLLLLILFVFIWQLFLTGGKDTAKPTQTAAAPSGGGAPPSSGTPPPPPAGGTPAPNAPSPDNASGGPPAPPPVPGTSTPPPETAPPSGPMGMPGPGAPTEKPPLPDDVTTWKGKDIQRAREEGNPKLIEAVTYIGGKKDYQNDVTAQGLAKLLKPLKPPETTPGQPSSPYPGGNGSPQPEVIKAIIFALGENGTPTARQTIVKILQGQVTTDDDRTAVDAALQVLVAGQSAPEFQTALLQILTQPETFRPQGAAVAPGPGAANPYQPAELQTRTWEMLKAQPAADFEKTAEFRKKLAEQLVAANLLQNQQFSEFLMQPDIFNFDAQMALYQNKDVPNEIHDQLEQHFINYASTALGQMLGIAAEDSEPGATPGAPSYTPPPTPSYTPPPRPSTPQAGRMGAMSFGGPAMNRRPGPGSAPAPYVPSPIGPTISAPVKLSGMEQAVHIAKQCWAGPLADSLLHQVDELHGLSKEPNVILLATTIPTDPFRAALYKLLKKRPLDGPQALDASGSTDQLVADPGMLVLVKLLPVQRKDWQNVRNGRAGGVGGYSPPPNPYGNPSGAVDPRQKREQAEQEWFNFSLKLLNAWRNRFETAAQLQKRLSRKKDFAGEPPPEKSADIEWPKNSKLQSACQLTWPNHAPKGLTPTVPGHLKIQFFHLETEGQIKKITTLLSRGLRNSKMHYLDSGVWLDILKSDPERNAKRSIDIVITHADKSPYDPSIRKEEDSDLQIDVLTIEIPDPSAAAESPPDKTKHPGEHEKKG
jgi:hypothetical protein